MAAACNFLEGDPTGVRMAKSLYRRTKLTPSKTGARRGVLRRLKSRCGVEPFQFQFSEVRIVCAECSELHRVRSVFRAASCAQRARRVGRL